MTGYLDSASFTKKTFSYDDLKKSIDIAARLSAFESVYDSYRAQKDGKTLYYDFLISFDRARQAYNDLCSIVLSGEYETEKPRGTFCNIYSAVFG